MGIAKRRKTSKFGPFAAIPWRVMDSPNYRRMSCKAVRCLVDLIRAYNGGNNGRLALTWERAVECGWVSRETLDTAKRELMHYGMIMRTRQGGRGRASLFVVTWLHTHPEVVAGLDITLRPQPLDLWCVERPPFNPARDQKIGCRPALGMRRRAP